ncbi:pre-mRNA-splicing factor CWC25 homolog [Fagus crenata]
MALKFLNKKGWHMGSLRNIENVWKAEQKHEAEEKKLEELHKQIQEERERHEFRLLQEQAGLVPKQERLDFLYDAGLAVGKGSNSNGGGFKALEAKSTDTAKALEVPPSSSSSAAVPGALFEVDKKLHSDPLLMIRQREQQALARIKNNPVQMAIICKSVEEKAPKKKDHDKKESRKKHYHSSSKYQKHSSSRQQ